MSIMKILVALICLGVGTSVMAQQNETSAYKHLSRSINDDGKTLAIQISGERANGQKIQYDRTFNIADLSAEQRNALKNRVLDSLGVNMPDPPKPPSPPKPFQAGMETVMFRCETCRGRIKLIITGPNFSSTREVNTTKEDKPVFPFELIIRPGEYRYAYWQNGVRQMQLPFMVKDGEKNVVQVK